MLKRVVAVLLKLALMQQQQAALAAAALVHPAWDWEPLFENTVQHCLAVKTVNGSWPHQILNRSGNGGRHYVEINESMTWANNSRLITLAVPKGTPPPGGWPVLMDLLIQDYPNRTPRFKGVDLQARETCGMQGKPFVDPAAAAASHGAATSPACTSALTARCGTVQRDYVGCLKCALYNITNRRSLQGGDCPQNKAAFQDALIGRCTFGKPCLGGFCPATPPISPQCQRSIDVACNWTRPLASVNYRDYETNCSKCVMDKWFNASAQILGCPAPQPVLEVAMRLGYCNISKPANGGGGANGRGGHFDPVRLFWPFASPERMAMGCSCVNGSKFACGKPFDDGHLGQDFVPPGGFCDSDIFFGALWYQRLKQYALNNGIAVMEVNRAPPSPECCPYAIRDISSATLSIMICWGLTGQRVYARCVGELGINLARRFRPAVLRSFPRRDEQWHGTTAALSQPQEAHATRMVRKLSHG
jgi:hypothetical protein